MAENDLEKRKRRALGVPGREDEASLYPPVGRIPFERITSMSEDELDARIALHLQNENMFRPAVHPRSASRDGSSKPDAADGLASESNVHKRRLELKRGGLAMLEGYSPLGRTLSEWFRHEDDDTPAEIADPGVLLRSLISRHGSRDFKDRRKHVLRILKDVELFVPTRENAALLRKINGLIGKAGHRPLELHEIIASNTTHLRADDLSPTATRRRWDLHRILTLYLHMLQGLGLEAIAARMGLPGRSKDNVKTIASLHLTPTAKKLLPPMRGRSRRES